MNSLDHLIKASLAVVLLAGLDLYGSFAAREWTATHRTPIGLTGASAFLALYVVYVISLQYAELTTVTFGWIVLIQVGVLMLDHYRYAVDLNRGQLVAVVVILLAQGYLMLAPLLHQNLTPNTNPVGLVVSTPPAHLSGPR